MAKTEAAAPPSFYGCNGKERIRGPLLQAQIIEHDGNHGHLILGYRATIQPLARSCQRHIPCHGICRRNLRSSFTTDTSSFTLKTSNHAAILFLRKTYVCDDDTAKALEHHPA